MSQDDMMQYNICLFLCICLWMKIKNLLKYKKSYKLTGYQLKKQYIYYIIKVKPIIFSTTYICKHFVIKWTILIISIVYTSWKVTFAARNSFHFNIYIFWWKNSIVQELILFHCLRLVYHLIINIIIIIIIIWTIW